MHTDALILNDGDFFAMFRREDVIDERSFSGAQKPSNDGDRDSRVLLHFDCLRLQLGRVN